MSQKHAPKWCAAPVLHPVCPNQPGCGGFWPVADAMLQPDEFKCVYRDGL
jgi:hypothetical protein